MGETAVAGAHQSGCHSAHSCPSDHHSYVWYDANGQAWDCARPGSDRYDPSRDTTSLTYDGYPYNCRAAGGSAPAQPTDADGDGVADGVDGCPTVAAATPTGCPPAPEAPPASEAAPPVTLAAVVVAVLDGDTLRVRAPGAPSFVVRLLGVDAPELAGARRRAECGGREATANLRRFAPRGRAIALTTDPTQDTFDKHQRLLAYGRVAAVDLQRAQLLAGWARTYVYGRGFQRLAAHRASERRARNARRGGWRLCGPAFNRTLR